MKEYLRIIDEILTFGYEKTDRTGIGSISIPGVLFKHNMDHGFPMLTTKKMWLRLVASELQFFIAGNTDKAWLQERNNHIWDEWCNPMLEPYSNNDPVLQAAMAAENDLGPIYGWQWRHFGGTYINQHTDYSDVGIDQFADMIRKLKHHPDDRRNYVTAWQPNQIQMMALPPCHYGFQVTVTQGRLNLMWNQRSVDSILGLPFNIACYALLLHLLALECGLEMGWLSGFLGDTHVYQNHIDSYQMYQQNRDPKPLGGIVTKDFTNIFDWDFEQSEVMEYQSHDAIKFDIAI